MQHSMRILNDMSYAQWTGEEIQLRSQLGGSIRQMLNPESRHCMQYESDKCTRCGKVLQFVYVHLFSPEVVNEPDGVGFQRDGRAPGRDQNRPH